MVSIHVGVYIDKDELFNTKTKPICEHKFETPFCGICGKKSGSKECSVVRDHLKDYVCDDEIFGYEMLTLYGKTVFIIIESYDLEYATDNIIPNSDVTNALFKLLREHDIKFNEKLCVHSADID